MALTKVSGDLLESPLTIPSGSSIVIDSGATITNNGTATGFGGGKVLQVVQTVKTDIFAGAANGTEMSITGMSATITPTSSSSKIMVSAVLNYCCVSTTYGAYFKRGTTVIGIPPADGSRQLITSGLGYTADGNQIETAVIEYLDSPATTSATTYQAYIKCRSSGHTIYVNRSANDNDAATYDPRTTSTITVMEIAGGLEKQY